MSEVGRGVGGGTLGMGVGTTEIVGSADGMGVGWYSRRGAAIYRSVKPAWNNRNLRELCSSVESHCVFAHVRAASPASVVSEENCHPFRYGPLLFQHNGHVEGFDRIKRRLMNALPDELYNWVSGTTDSEACFALLDDDGVAVDEDETAGLVQPPPPLEVEDTLNDPDEEREILAVIDDDDEDAGDGSGFDESDGDNGGVDDDRADSVEHEGLGGINFGNLSAAEASSWSTAHFFSMVRSCARAASPAALSSHRAGRSAGPPTPDPVGPSEAGPAPGGSAPVIPLPAERGSWNPREHSLRFTPTPSSAWT